MCEAKHFMLFFGVQIVYTDRDEHYTVMHALYNTP